MCPRSSKIGLICRLTASNFHEDLQRVTDGRSDPLLGGVLVQESLGLVRWLKEVGGVEWWLSFKRQAYEVDGRWVFWGGLHLTVPKGGKGLIRALLGAVERHGCYISYDTDVQKILQNELGDVRGVVVRKNGELREIHSRSVILCAGGFEASPAMRKKWWECSVFRSHVVRITNYSFAPQDGTCLGARTYSRHSIQYRRNDDCSDQSRSKDDRRFQSYWMP